MSVHCHIRLIFDGGGFDTLTKWTIKKHLIQFMHFDLNKNRQVHEQP